MLGIAKIGIVALLLTPRLLHLLLANEYTGLLCSRPSSKGFACNSLCSSPHLCKNLWVLYYNFPHWLMHKTIAFHYLEIQIKKTLWTSLVVQTVKHLSTMRETWVPSLGHEDLLEKEMAIHSSTTAWKTHGQRSLVGYSLWGRKESGMTERLPFNFPYP